LQLLKSWKLTFQPGYDELKEIGIKTFVQFTEFDSGDMALSLKLPDKNYEIKGKTNRMITCYLQSCILGYNLVALVY